MVASFQAELMKLVRRPAIWAVVGVWMTLSLVFGYVFPYFTSIGEPAGPGAAQSAERALSTALPAALVPSAIQGFPMFAGALAVLLGVLVTGSEYGWDTVKAMLTAGPGRVAVLAGKLLALATVMLLVVLTTFAVDAGAATLVAAITSEAMHWPSLSALVTGVGAGWLIVSMWAFGGALLGEVLRGTALAVGIGVVWTLAIENLLRVFGSLVGGVNTLLEYLPGTNAGALAAARGVLPAGRDGGVPGVTVAGGGGHAIGVLSVYLVLVAGAAGLLLHRRDVT